MPKKLLLADDSITIQKVVGITFANEDYELTVVDNGADAVLKAREIKPDLILADIVMPEKDGYEVCREIKSDQDLSSTPVILLTGTFEPFDEDKSAEVGADDYITKPFESQALVDKVKSHLEKVSVAVSAAGPEQAEEPEMPPAEQEFEEEIMELGEEDILEMAPDVSAPALEEAGESLSQAEVGVEASVSAEEPEVAETGDEIDLTGMLGPEEDEEGIEDELAGFGFDETLSELEAGAEAPEPAAEEAEEDIDLEVEVEEDVDILSAPEEETEPEELFEETVAPEPPQAEIQEEFTAAETLEEEPPAAEPISYPDLPESGEKEEITAAEAVSGMTDDKLEAIVSKVAKDVIEKIAWEVVPELAEALILEEIKRLKEGKPD